jgi:hypothetical protein
MNIYLINDKIVLSKLEVPKNDGNGYVARIFIPWLKETKEVHMFPNDEDIIKNMFPKNTSKHHVVDITEHVYTIAALSDENGIESVFMGYLKQNKKMETKTEKFVVMVEGRNAPTKLHDTYESAEIEAKRLCEKERKNAYVLKVVSLIELPPVEFKITKF